MKKIAIIEDEEDIAELIEHHLLSNNFSATKYENGSDFISDENNKSYDLILLDLMLPDMDGMEICRYIRQNNDLKQIPIIMLSAKDQEFDKVLGLEMGADDYVTKPFSPRELIARIKNLFRRFEKSTVSNESKKTTISGSVYIDFDKHQAFVDDNPIKLTKTEFKILAMLSERKGWVLSREKLLEHLWGHDKIVSDRTIDVHIKHLRDKLGDTGKLIKNLQGIGYKLENE